MPTAVTTHAPGTSGHETGRDGKTGERRSRTHELGWRLIEDEPRRGAANMALDHALAERLADGEGVVRLYGWSRPTVSFGKNEPAAGSGPDLDYVRRPTGGRAVVHDDELTYAVVAPLDAFGGLREAYLTINRALADAIRALGVPVDVAGDRGSVAGAVEPLDAGACFQSPARGEIVVAGRKLVGSAQARLEGVLLQHGSILLGGEQRRLGTTGSEPVTLGELLGQVSLDGVRSAVRGSLGAGFGGEWQEGAYRSDELEAADRLESERYGLDTWTWRKRREQT